MRLPPLITWSDVRWTLFVVAGIAFLYGVLALSVAALKVGGVWGWVIVIAALAVIVALIGRELWASWLGSGCSPCRRPPLDNGQRSPRRLLAALVRRLVASLRR